MVDGPVAFVLGGGGVLGAVEVGMVRALFRAGFRPDVVVGTSIGAVNGALVAADPSEGVTERLVRLWTSPEAATVYGDSLGRQMRRFAARTHLHSPLPLRRLLENELGERATFADLKIPFRCCAASIERAAEHWFDSGPLVDAVLASSSVPGLLPPMHIGHEHFVDGLAQALAPTLLGPLPSRAAEPGAHEGVQPGYQCLDDEVTRSDRHQAQCDRARARDELGEQRREQQYRLWVRGRDQELLGGEHPQPAGTRGHGDTRCHRSGPDDGSRPPGPSQGLDPQVHEVAHPGPLDHAEGLLGPDEDRSEAERDQGVEDQDAAESTPAPPVHSVAGARR